MCSTATIHGVGYVHTIQVVALKKAINVFVDANQECSFKLGDLLMRFVARRSFRIRSVVLARR